MNRGGPNEAEGDRRAITLRILRSLATSETRRKLLLYLFNNPQKFHYLEEIVKSTGLSHSNVLGAIIGDGKNYSETLSLVSLGLVDVVVNDGYRYYRLTDVGFDVSKSLNGRKL